MIDTDFVLQLFVDVLQTQRIYDARCTATSLPYMMCSVF